MSKGFLATVRLGPKGQIVIPKEVREMFGVGPGDSLILMADPTRGIALQKHDFMMKIAKTILDGNGQTLYPEESNSNLEAFAEAINHAEELP